MAIITVLYDTKNATMLGKGGRWVSCAEFAKMAPEKPEDLIPPEHPPAVPDPDPGPTYKCINHKLHLCIGTLCYPLGASC